MLWDYLCNAKSHSKSASIDWPSHASIYKIEDCREGGEGLGKGVAVVVDKATQGDPKWQTLDKTKASSTEPAQKENRETKDNALPLIHCFHSPQAQGGE